MFHVEPQCSRASVDSVARSNPGDGTKRLYGETSIIHDGSDIEGVHPDAVGTGNNNINRKPTVEDVDDDGDEVMTYLEDTAARG